MNPFDVLGVPVDADDRTVRAAYLALVKRYPPERYPERHMAINTAYQALKDENSRLQYLLFDTQPGGASPMEVVAGHFRWCDRRKPPDWETLRHRILECASRKEP